MLSIVLFWWLVLCVINICLLCSACFACAACSFTQLSDMAMVLGYVDVAAGFFCTPNAAGLVAHQGTCTGSCDASKYDTLAPPEAACAFGNWSITHDCRPRGKLQQPAHLCSILTVRTVLITSRQPIGCLLCYRASSGCCSCKQLLLCCHTW
jgi:hypothetical protein